MKTKIEITIYGGLVANIVSTNPDLEYRIIDLDIKDLGEENYVSEFMEPDLIVENLQ
jgi:hypothetical protein